jgi:hypothetical protein
MKITDLYQAVKDWDLSSLHDFEDDLGRFDGAAGRFESMLKRLEWFGKNHWDHYLPAESSDYSSQYMVRLAEWIGNVDSDEDRQLLFKYALHIAFLSHKDLCALYRAAFSGVITRWVIERGGLSLDDHDFDLKLKEELYKGTWYCPVTDSMDINEFYHVNHLVGLKHRPQFAFLEMLDMPSDQSDISPSRLIRNLQKYLNKPNPAVGAPPLKRLVLLEDFVGTGTQCAGALKWAAKNLDLAILFVPLVVCAPGLTELSKIVTTYPDRLQVQGLLTLTDRDLLGEGRKGFKGIPNAEKIEDLARRTFQRIAGSKNLNPRKAPHTAFGFEGTGTSFVSYSNAPNNTLPLIHHRPDSGGWNPLFPRSSRA